MIDNDDYFDNLSVEEMMEGFDESALEERAMQDRKTEEEDQHWTKLNDAKKLQVERNIHLVQKLRLKGLKTAREQQQALEKMGISVGLRTVYKYRGILKKRNLRRLNKQDGLTQTVEEIAKDLKEQFDEVLKELWSTYHSSKTESAAKVSALKAIMKISDDMIDKLQSLGLVHKEPEKTQVLGPDGLPVDPEANIKALNEQFISFIKAKYQDPTGTLKNEHQES